MEEIFHANGNQNRRGKDILISHNIDNKLKKTETLPGIFSELNSMKLKSITEG